ncbi:porin [Colwellia sp. D2M02]|uniref:porin n=1 Tax=Colwellia sp. D2M02 TaxID=2841562 RepID=UPI00209085AF|nr:porin [Colwellia sp. D2M02]
MISKKNLLTLSVIGALSSVSALNAYAAPSNQSSDTSFNDAWKMAELYQNEQGDYFKLSGRLQLDSTWVDAEQGEFNDTEWRRFRFGFKAKKGEFKFALEGDFNLNTSLDDSYRRLTDANVAWALNKNTELKFLKQSTGFTLDGKTSSNRLLTPQRNNLSNNLWFTAEYFTGVSVKSSLSNGWKYKTGVFSSDGSDELSVKEASYFALLSTSKKLEKNALWEQGELGIDYVYNDTHEHGNTRKFSQIVSVSSKLKQQAWGLDTDISWGKGDLGQSNLFGVVLMPTLQQTEKLIWVARYTYLNSKDNNGVRLGRYDRDIVSGRGDQYQEVYGGMNYLVNGHKLKFQAGVHYAKMQDSANDGGEYAGWGLTLAMRSFW